MPAAAAEAGPQVPQAGRLDAVLEHETCRPCAGGAMLLTAAAGTEQREARA